MSDQTWSKLANQAIKPITNAGVAYLGSRLMGIGGNYTLPFWGYGDANVNLALSAGVVSVGTEIIGNWVLPEVVDGVQSQSMSSNILRPVLMSGGLYLLTNYASPGKTGQIGGMNVALLGAGSEIASSYAVDNFIQPWINPQDI